MKQNERELYKKWGAGVAPPMPSVEPASDKYLWVDDDPVHVGEILIRAGKTVAFKLDEANQSFELDNDLENIAVAKLRTVVHSVKDLIIQTVPGTADTRCMDVDHEPAPQQQMMCSRSFGSRLPPPRPSDERPLVASCPCRPFEEMLDDQDCLPQVREIRHGKSPKTRALPMQLFCLLVIGK